MSRTLRICLSALTVLSIALSDKAFHIDDLVFINLSRMIEWNPLAAVAVDYRYMGSLLRGMLPYEITHPLLVPYFIKIGIALGGEQEVFLHLWFLIFPLLALAAGERTYRVLYPGRSSALVLLCIATMPAFVVNAQTLMTDIPALAFLLISVALYCQGIENRTAVLMFGGGVVMTLAVFTSYQSVAFIPLIAWYAVQQGRLGTVTVASLSVPLIALIAWFGMVYSRYDIFPILRSAIASHGADISSEISRGLTIGTLAGKAVYMSAAIGASSFAAEAVYRIRRGVSWRYAAALLLLAAVVFGIALSRTSYPLHQTALLALFVAGGIIVMIECVRLAVFDRRGREAKVRLFLMTWIIMVMAYNLFLMPFGSMRYLLPALPAIVMLLLGAAPEPLPRGWRTLLERAVLTLAVIVAVASAYVDYQYADTYRNFAEEAALFRQDKGMKCTMWYLGEWGMRYYMDKNGAQYLFRMSKEPKKGDYVVTAMMPRQWQPLPQVTERLTLYATREYNLRLPLRLFNIRSNAGFYGHYWGLLPFSFSHEPLESFEIWEVVR